MNNNVPLFLETIKIVNGRFYNLPLHLHRMYATLQHFFSKALRFSIREEDIPEEYRNGRVKCRIIYSEKHWEIEYVPYVFKTIHSLKVVENNTIRYDFKFYDRTSLDTLLTQKESADDILILQNGEVTDTSFSNVVFQDTYGKLYTPASCLLAGTKRKKLIAEGRILERKIKISDISNYEKLFLINAMIDLEDQICICPQNLI